MSEYNLNSTEAVAELARGEILECDSTDFIYKNDNGKLLSAHRVRKDWRESTMEFNEFVMSKWRIVENPKCWLESNVEKFGFGSKVQKSVYMELGRELAHEVINRIYELPEAEPVFTIEAIKRTVRMDYVVTMIKQLTGEDK